MHTSPPAALATSVAASLAAASPPASDATAGTSAEDDGILASPQGDGWWGSLLFEAEGSEGGDGDGEGGERAGSVALSSSGPSMRTAHDHASSS